MADPIKAPITYPVIAGGKIVTGGSVVFGAANVKPDPENPATLKSIWLDNALTQQAQNPQGLDSNGVFDQSSNGLLYGEVADTYSVVVFDANGSELSYIPVYDLSDANAAITAQEAATEAQTAEAGAISAKNITETLYSDFLIRYFGAYAADPATNDEGNPPEEGSLYWNSTIKAFRVYNQGSWVAAKDLAVVVPTILPRLVGDGTTTDYNLGFSSADTDSFLVYIDGSYQKPVDNFTVDFNTGVLSFVAAPPNGSSIDITYFDPSTIANLNNSLVTATGTTTPRTLADRFGGTVTPIDFGAVGDGLADDTEAVEACLNIGLPVDWLGKNYKITRGVIVDGVNVRWYGKGANVRLESAAEIHRAILVDNLPTGINFIEDLEIDGDNSAFVGIRVKSYLVGGNKELLLDNITVSNIYRSSTSFTEGNGIFIDGAYDLVSLDNIKVNNVKMAQGAGVSGVQGITGISIRANGNGRPSLVSTNNISIDGVFSEDLDYFADQDGLLVWTDRNNSPTSQQETTLQASKTFFKNCLGRSIKCQVESANINGTRIVRTYGHTTPGVGVDIDLQVGGGRVSGVSCLYSGWAPKKVVLINSTDELSKALPNGHVDGVEVAMSNTISIESVVQTGLRGNPEASYRVSNINVQGGSLDYVMRVPLSDNAVIHASLSGATAAPNLSFVGGTNGAGSGYVNISDVHNIGNSLVPAYSRTSTNVNLVANVISGTRLLSDRFLEEDKVGDILRVTSIAPKDSGQTSGLLKPVSFELANDETYKFPDAFRNANSGVLIVSIGSNRNGQGFYACDSSRVIELSNSAPDITVGLDAEPASGNFRLWSSVDGPYMSNRSGTTRTITCLMFG